jgi:CRP/FNR family transcriptional regulator, cyclic AMP receptor protein
MCLFTVTHAATQVTDIRSAACLHISYELLPQVAVMLDRSTLRTRISEQLWDDLVSNAVSADVAAGKPVFTGSRGRLGAVLAGRVRMFTWASSGRQVTIRYARPGDLIGLTPLLSGDDTWSSEAVVDSRVAVIALEHLRDLSTQHPELAWAIAEESSMLSADAVRTIIGAGYEPMPVRLASHLLELAVQTSDGQTVVRATHKRLAEAVGTAREVVTRVLKRFRESGIIEIAPGSIVILDPEELEAVGTANRQLLGAASKAPANAPARPEPADKGE